MSLASDVRRGALWSALGSIVLRAGTFVTGILVARLVAPEEVGVFVVALTVQLVIISASELGVATAVARSTSSVAALAPTATTLALGSSIVLSALMAATAPLLASLLGSPSAAPAIEIMSVTVLLAGAASVSNGLLMRDFLQKRRLAGELAGFLVGGVGILALSGLGATGLSLARVLGQAVTTIVIVAVAPARFLPGFDREQARSLLRFGVPLVGASGLGFATTNADYVVVGRMGGPSALGPYSLAFNVASWPLTLLSTVVSSVALPAFARAQGDRDRLTRQVGLVVGAVAAIGFPMSALTAVLALPLVVSLYGGSWAAAAPALVALTLVGALRVPLDVLGSLIVSSGLTRAYLLIQAAQLAVSVPALIAGVAWGGIVGAGLAQLVVTAIVVLPAYAAVSARLVGIDVRPAARALLPAAGAAAACGLAAAGARSLVAGSWAQLVAGGAAGLAVYAVLMAPTARRYLALGAPQARAARESPAVAG